MKKLCLVMAMCLIMGCGGSSGGESESTSSGTDPIVDCEWTPENDTAPTYVDFDISGDDIIADNYCDWPDDIGSYQTVTWCCAIYDAILPGANREWVITFNNDGAWNIYSAYQYDGYCKPGCE